MLLSALTGLQWKTQINEFYSLMAAVFYPGLGKQLWHIYRCSSEVWGYQFSRILAQRASLPTCFCCQLFPADEGPAAGTRRKGTNSFHCLSLLHSPQDLLCSHFPALFLFHNFLLFFTASQLQRPYLGSSKSIGKVDFYGDGFQIVFI